MEIYKGRCAKEDEKELLEMLDDVFFSEDDEATKRTFLELLPKLYKDKYNPGYNNVIIKEDGEIKAAVGCYPLDVTAAQRKLRCMGIGNVAVAKDSRRKGYMVELMNLALDIMKEEDFDYSLLGGQRQRYGYFGYEPTGAVYRFTINKGNIAHIKGKDYKTPFTVKELTENDAEEIDRIVELYRSQPYYMDRNRENCLDVLRSWRSIPYAAYHNGEFKGYFSVEKFGGLQEIKAVNIEDTIDIILCAMDIIGSESVTFGAPAFDADLCDYMIRYGCGASISNVDMINIFNFGKFIEAFLAVKALRVNLPTGTFVIRINGFKRVENFAITVVGKDVVVTEVDAVPDLEIDHHRAIDLICGIYSKERNALPVCAQSWFPLDFYAYGLDNV